MSCSWRDGIVKTFKLIVHLANGTNLLAKTQLGSGCIALHCTRREIDFNFDRKEGVEELVCRLG